MKKNIGQYAWPIAFVIVIIFTFYGYFFSEPINPRLKNGVDSVYLNDSIYVLKFQIDTVIVDEKYLDDKRGNEGL